MRRLLLPVLLLISSFSFAQSFQLGLFGGITNYQGDLVDKIYVSRFTRPAFGITGTYAISDRFDIRGGLTFGKIMGYDRYNTKDYLQARNLSFETRISEFSVVGEFNVFNLNDIRWTPYLFGGAAVFKFNPYTYDGTGTKTFLQPLGTEGQGLPGYSEKPYKLTQLSLPFGVGLKYALSEQFELGLEVGLRKTFTDYLDDVSTNYADEADLLAGPGGTKAAELAFRGDEVPGSTSTYPAKGSQRGGANELDVYYITGFHLKYRLGSGSGGGLFGKGKKGYGCPAVPL